MIIGQFNWTTVTKSRIPFCGLLVPLAVIVAIGAAPSNASAAQPAGSTIGGVVRDESGGAIPGALVRIVNGDIGSGCRGCEQRARAYYRRHARARAYRLEAALDGFEPAVRKIVLTVGAGVGGGRDADARAID